MSKPEVPQASFIPSRAQVKARNNLVIQAFRFIAINLKMIAMIRKGHH